jgi:UDP-2,3-diacylglucosamine pyrophosphatase LpxH
MLVHYDTIMVSDVHLGNKMSRSKALTAMLRSGSFENLILLGDIFQDIDFERLNSDDWGFLGYVRELSKTKKVIWVVGNHDWDISKIMTNMVGAKTYEQYEFRLPDGSLNIALHGHVLQGGSSNSPAISRIGGALMLGIQKIFGNTECAKRFYKNVDSIERDLSKAAERVKAGAFKLAQKKGYRRVFCGHTHTPEMMYSEDREVVYYNTGHWLAERCSYVAIRGASVYLEFYDAGV